MNTIPRLCVVAAFCLAATSPALASDYPAHVLAESELRVLPPSPSGRHYQLHIRLPAGYSEESDRRYPVVYVTDGYWHTHMIGPIERGLAQDRYAPKFIVVGLGYAGENLDYSRMRRWELIPGPREADSGHGEEFLRSIKSEIIPFVEREYRVDSSYRVLAGASLGGLFTLYALHAEPGLFHACVAATPAVIVGNEWLFDFEEKFAGSDRTLRGRLFMSVGGNESPGWVAAALRFNARIASRDYPDLAYEFRIIDGERHAGMQFESYQRGLRFAFAPLAPESGPTANR